MNPWRAVYRLVWSGAVNGYLLTELVRLGDRYGVSEVMEAVETLWPEVGPEEGVTFEVKFKPPGFEPVGWAVLADEPSDDTILRNREAWPAHVEPEPAPVPMGLDLTLRQIALRMAVDASCGTFDAARITASAVRFYAFLCGDDAPRDGRTTVTTVSGTREFGTEPDREASCG